MIGSLTKARFCNALGHPISKSSWANSSDYDISTNLCVYAKIFLIITVDPQKKKNLYRIKYILRLSCVRTLARKHKSVVRPFLKKLGSEFLEEFLIEEEQTLSLILPRVFSTSRNLSRGRFWCFDIICINDLVNHE